MQRVGGKAGGFINKKFFHPSSLRNQEKLWKAQTEESQEKRKQAQLEKQREEERQVEQLRKQMYLRGQSNAGDYLTSGASASGDLLTELDPAHRKEAKAAHDEFKRRKVALKQQQAKHNAEDGGEEAGDKDDQDDVNAQSGDGGVLEEASSETIAAAEISQKPLAKSMYREDVHPMGHQSVWGSWFCKEAMKWGFTCCKGMRKRERCPLAPEEEEKAVITAEKGQPSERASKRQRKNAAKAARWREAEAEKAAAAAGENISAAGASGGDQEAKPPSEAEGAPAIGSAEVTATANAAKATTVGEGDAPAASSCESTAPATDA